MTDPNQRFAELAGLEWHDIEPPNNQCLMYRCTCGADFGMPLDAIQHQNKNNPDFTDAREVLKVMEGKNTLSSFLLWLSKDESVNRIHVHLVLDTTGKLRDLAIEWMEKEAE